MTKQPDRWEYNVIRHRDIDPQEDTIAWLDEYGEKGWELVQISEPGFVFKRRVVDAEKG